MRNLILVICTIQLVYGAPQMITFKDGKVGVNFAGYSASAGLGGLLTGDASHGFLSASAGTPNGQHASAGLGGDLNNQASGIAYANAQATPNKKTVVQYEDRALRFQWIQDPPRPRQEICPG